jgi:hypothetical protein
MLPCEIETPYHIQDDVLKHLKDGWDLMIAHPDCTYFANAGLHYLKIRPERKQQLRESYDFLLKLWNAPVERIAIENPVGWLNTHWQKPSQIIQPYYFGEPERKTTCLWLKNLPPLVTSGAYFPDVKPVGYCIRKTGNKAGQKYNYYFRQGKTAENRSRTFLSIAKAMAEQWG